MKTLTNIFFKATILAVAVLPMLTSCYDDSSIWDKFDDIEHRLDSLENSLNQQFQALNSILDGQTTVTSCDKNADGSYDVTLSNGAKFTVLPDGTNYSALVSVTTVNGVKCWATYDSNGKLVALTNDAGEPVPVVNEYKAKVEVVVEDGKYYLVIDGNKYMTGYDTEKLVQVFSSCTPLKDASGNVYAMQFTFGDGQTVTIALDGYNGVIFRLPNSLDSSVLTEYYIENGDTQSVLLEMTGVVDYIMQIPDGWRVVERIDEYTDETFIDITAPSTEVVESGAAVEGGELKVVAVVEGGKAAVSKLSLSSDPFKVFDINGNKAVIEPYAGVQKYVYGIIEKSKYDEEALLAEVKNLLKSSGDLPAGFATADRAISADHTETFGGTLTNNVEYIFWALPALYNETDGFYAKEGTFDTYEFSVVNVRFNNVSTSLFDAELNVTFNGVEKIYAGTCLKTSTALSDIVRLINNDGYASVEAPETYQGKASEFPNAQANAEVEFLPATTYISWVVPAQEGKTNYTVNDIISKEFTTKSITSGSSLEVTFGEVSADMTSINVPISSTGAEMLYYLYMSKSDGDRIASLSNDDKADIIFENSETKTVKASEAAAKVDKLTPSTSMWLYTVAVDSNGKYGKVNSISATTTALEYNSLTVTASDLEIGSDEVTFQITVSGGEATEFVYWVGKSNDDFWLNSKYLGASQEKAQEYMALYPEDANIVKVMNQNGNISADGVLKVTGLANSTEYVLVVIAKDASGHYSKAGYKMITTLAADLGTIVREGSTEWNTAKGLLQIKWDETFKKGSSQLFSSFGFEFSCPTNYTAFITCNSKEYYEDVFKTVEDRIIDIRDYASRKLDRDRVPFDSTTNDYVTAPNWYDNNGVEKKGTLLNVYTYYVHGDPSNGSVTYFGNVHDSSTCPSWSSDVCENFEIQKEKIAKNLSIEKWRDRFINNYGVTNEEYLEKNAQAYYEAYYPYYKNAEPKVYVNTGGAIRVNSPYASGVQDGKVVDDVTIVLMDENGNFYEPMYFDVPNNFK